MTDTPSDVLKFPGSGARPASAAPAPAAPPAASPEERLIAALDLIAGQLGKLAEMVARLETRVMMFEVRHAVVPEAVMHAVHGVAALREGLLPRAAGPEGQPAPATSIIPATGTPGQG